MLRRPQTDGVRNPRAAQRGFSDVELAAIDPLASNKGIVVGNSHRVHIARVHVVEVTNVRVEDVPVADKGVVNVDPLREARAAAEPWEERLTKTQGKPADAGSESTTEETHESGPVDRSTVDGPRAPAPPAADVRPAAVVVGGKAPG